LSNIERSVSRPPVAKRSHTRPPQTQRKAAQSPAASRANTGSAHNVLHLQRLAGNRAVSSLLAGGPVQAKLNVGPANDRYEQEADRIANQLAGGPQPANANLPAQRTSGAPVAQASPAAPVANGGFQANPALESQVAGSRGAGQALPGAMRAEMEAGFGADFSRVRLHTGPDATQMNRAIQSQAFTQGNDIYLGAPGFNPQSGASKHLLAHELTHVVQQGGAAMPGGALQRQAAVSVQNRLPADRVSTKRMKMHLDFVRMKRLPIKTGKILAQTLGLEKRLKGKQDADDQGGTYGHWWTELGDLDGDYPGGKWTPVQSYGWWPSQTVSDKRAFTGVPGQLNQGQRDDPHHGETVATNQMFHPVMDVDSAADYKTVRDQVINDIRNFANGYHGQWMWRFGWGKNCHTFQQQMKKAVGIHNQKGKGWLKRPNDSASLDSVVGEQRRQEERAAYDKEFPGVDYTLNGDLNVSLANDSPGPQLKAGTVVRLLNDQIGAASLDKLEGWMKVQIMVGRNLYSLYFSDFQKRATAV
jgi:hypothetical protein